MTNKKEETKKKTVTKKGTKSVPKKETKKKETKKVPTILQEENHYGRTILAAVLICIIFLTGYFLLKNTENGNSLFNNQKVTEDEQKFKKEYESINGTSRTNGETIKKIDIIENNKMVYTSLSDANEIIENGTGIIYFGYAADSASRIILPVLLDVIKEQEIEKVYYVNVRPDDKIENDIRDTYELNDKNKAKQIRESSSEYRNLITLLANELNDYILTTDKGKKINTGEKRLNVPTVVAIHDGEIVGFHEGTVSSNKEENGKYQDLTKEEEQELKSIYQKIMKDFLAQ